MGTTKIPQVKNPCPMTLARVTEGDGTFYCNACSNAIIDFRSKSITEIKEIIGSKKVCGIFNEDQLAQPKFSFKYKLHYAALTLIAFIGFNVKPINAQSEMIAKDTSTNQICPKTQTKGERQNEKNRKTIARKRRRYERLHPRRPIMGCPAF